MNRPLPPRRHGGVAKTIHWLTLALLVGVYALAWSIDGAGSRNEAAWLIMMHRSFGILVLMTTSFRLIWRRISGVPGLPETIPYTQQIAAGFVAVGLYLLLFLQPLLGLAASQAHGDAITVFGAFNLPVFIGKDRALSHRLFGLHGTVALLLLALISLHAGAALYHHFIRRDDVLRGMLPALRLRPRRSDLTEA
jgi:cytochrome b561